MKRLNWRFSVWCLTLFFITIDLLNPASLFAQENWPRFRGPNGMGLALDAELPASWTPDQVAWSADLAGNGNSSPVIWGDKLFVTSADPDSASLHVECFDFEGGQRNWIRTFSSSPYRVHRMNSFASGTPAADAKHVYVAYADPDHTWLVALEHGGEEVWRRDFGKWVSQHGFSMSPIAIDDRVIFFNSEQGEQLREGQTPGQSEMIAVDAATGEDVWRTRLATDRACYSVPCVADTDAGRKLIGCSQGEGFFQIDMQSGKLEQTESVFRMRTVASALIHGDLVYGSNGSGGGGNYLVAMRRTDAGWDKAFEVNRNANYVPTPLVVGDELYLFGDKGIVSCVDAKTGQSHWRERLSSEFAGSPVSNGKQIYVMDAAGTVHVVQCGREFKLLFQADLGQPTRATPAIAGNRIFFRTESRLIAVGE